MYSHDFYWAVRTLEDQDGDGRVRKRSPALVAGMADHIWTIGNWIAMPGVQSALGHHRVADAMESLASPPRRMDNGS
jgi:hypothetical protein